MPSNSGSTTHLPAPSAVLTPAATVDMLEAQWVSRSKKRLVQTSKISQHVCEPLRLLSLPEWPGVGDVETSSDVMPLVTIPEMPANEYPKYVQALTAYTLAELACQRPHLAAAARKVELTRIALLVVSVRVGVWAALGRTPVHQPSVSSEAVRWSNRNGCLVVRPAAVGDPTATWRQFLAMHPGLPSDSLEVAEALCGAAPLLFLMGSALLLQAGEVYAMHYLERDMSSFLRATLSAGASQLAMLELRPTWDTLNAAAIGGYRASIMRHISADHAFATAATMRISTHDRSALAKKLDAIISSSPMSHRGFPREYSQQAPRSREATAVDEDRDDTVSVADTEDLGPADDRRSGASTPRGQAPPSLADEDVAKIHAAYREVPMMSGGAASAARNIPEQESIVW
jgi:hypothetical protein